MTAAPSNILQSYSGGGSGCFVLEALTHVKRCDFFPNLSFPNWERDGGKGWFSCIKKLV